MVRGLISKQQHMQRLPFIYHLKSNILYSVLAILSNGCPNLEGRLSTCYSPVRHSTHSPKRAFSFDLHVLSTPPAFILSQDQTLQLYFSIYLVSLFSSLLYYLTQILSIALSQYYLVDPLLLLTDQFSKNKKTL